MATGDPHTSPLTLLDRRIVGALQLDGRAPWRRIAAVLGESERTVARRGAQLLANGVVVVTGLSPLRAGAGNPWVLRLQCAPGTTQLAAGALARRNDSNFTYITTGAYDLVTEVMCPDNRIGALTMEELPLIRGIVRSDSAPIVRVHRSVHNWEPHVLSPDERTALTCDIPLIRIDNRAAKPSLTNVDRTILRALAEDGRCNNEELARMCGVSEATARRRVETLRADGLVYFRAVIEPALLGLPIEALLWLRVAPTRIDEVGQLLAEDSAVRYASEIASDANFVVDVTAADRGALRTLITTSRWAILSETVEVSFLIESLKRSTVLAARLRRTSPLED
ncbi:Lrp/AsnC family transcriptional regulator [Rhodococcus qingshengii]|uniref:Lrp/AsnC family transcriptional regulator n=1 Tax=Rhodococcus qingshengii TaxID=334542 RepID=UPI0036DD4EFD